MGMSLALTTPTTADKLECAIEMRSTRPPAHAQRRRPMTAEAGASSEPASPYDAKSGPTRANRATPTSRAQSGLRLFRDHLRRPGCTPPRTHHIGPQGRAQKRRNGLIKLWVEPASNRQAGSRGFVSGTFPRREIEQEKVLICRRIVVFLTTGGARRARTADLLGAISAVIRTIQRYPAWLSEIGPAETGLIAGCCWTLVATRWPRAHARLRRPDLRAEHRSG